MPKLEGRIIALLESRKSDDLASMVQRFGGVPRSVPTVKEVLRTEDFTPVLARLIRDEFTVVVVLTAAACEALFAEAARHGVLDDVIAALSRVTLVARGPKPLLPLRRRGLIPQVVTERPHTTEELRIALASTELADACVLLLHYGERNETFSADLTARGARVEHLSLYEWALPDDTTPLRTLIDDTIHGRIDAMLFTSQVQFRHLLSIAQEAGCELQLAEALRDRIVVGSVGPVCSRVLRAAGIVPDVMPHLPNGPSLVQALSDYYSMFTPPEEPTS